MKFNSSFRFRTKKMVGSPNAVGCGQITMASHVGDSNAHPQYMKVGDKVSEFSIAPHLDDCVSHADHFIRRAETVEGKRDYMMTRYLSLINDPNNYRAELEAKRYVITSYVLRHILEDFGFTDDTDVGACINLDHIVKIGGSIPSFNQDAYVPSWSWMKRVINTVDELTAKMSDVATLTGCDLRYAPKAHDHGDIYAPIAHKHKWEDIIGIDASSMATKTWVETRLSTFLSGINKAIKNIDESIAEEVAAKVADVTATLGYTPSLDTTAIGDIPYYRFNAASGRMEVCFAKCTSEADAVSKRAAAHDPNPSASNWYVKDSDLGMRRQGYDKLRDYIVPAEGHQEAYEEFYVFFDRVNYSITDPAPYTLTEGDPLPSGFYLPLNRYFAWKATPPAPEPEPEP